MLPTHTHYERRLAQQWPAARWQDVHVVVACSGGPDSTALLRAMLALLRDAPPKLIVAHFNHHWRGADSDSDQQFVESLAQQWRLPCQVGHAPRAGTPSSSRPDEDTARRLRHQFLLQTARHTGARHVVVAHTADDQAETILHRIVRGTGIAGLAGMQRVRALNSDVSLVRPMLDWRRHEVLEYLEALGQTYCTDASNDDCQYTRSRIRHQLLPLLQSDYNARVVDALLQLGQIASRATQDAQQRVDPCLAAAVTRSTTDCVQLRCDLVMEQLTPYDQAELFRILWQRQHWPLQSMGYRQWCELVAMLDGPERTAMFPGAVRAQRHGELLTLARHARPSCTDT